MSPCIADGKRCNSSELILHIQALFTSAWVLPRNCQVVVKVFPQGVVRGKAPAQTGSVYVSTPASKANTHRLVEAKEPRLCHKLLDLLASLPI